MTTESDATAARSAGAPAEAAARLLALVEEALVAALPEPASQDDFGAARLVESMTYSLRTPGKRIRPVLLLATAESLGAAAAPLARLAAGLEMIHAYSLIHDDLPAMDDDELRRGQPTNHVVFGEGMAILAGDGLLTEAFVAMLEPVADAALQSRVVVEIARAAGREGMVGGQAADLLAEGVDPDAAVLRSIHARKTGALIHVAVRAGALLAGAGPEVLAAAETFGRRFGLAFQIADDIKDEVAPEAVTGKHGGGDRSAGKMTYPFLYGIEESRAMCLRELAAATAALAPLGGGAALLEHIARESVAPAFADPA